MTSSIYRFLHSSLTAFHREMSTIVTATTTTTIDPRHQSTPQDLLAQTMAKSKHHLGTHPHFQGIDNRWENNKRWPNMGKRCYIIKSATRGQTNQCGWGERGVRGRERKGEAHDGVIRQVKMLIFSNKQKWIFFIFFHNFDNFDNFSILFIFVKLTMIL